MKNESRRFVRLSRVVNNIREQRDIAIGWGWDGSSASPSSWALRVRSPSPPTRRRRASSGRGFDAARRCVCP